VCRRFCQPAEKKKTLALLEGAHVLVREADIKKIIYSRGLRRLVWYLLEGLGQGLERK
jgi:hypothetical protein